MLAMSAPLSMKWRGASIWVPQCMLVATRVMKVLSTAIRCVTVTVGYSRPMNGGVATPQGCDRSTSRMGDIPLLLTALELALAHASDDARTLSAALRAANVQGG